MKYLYPDIEPFHQFYLKTESNHCVYVEQSGNPQGVPVIFLHGGPCSGTKPHNRCFFNPEKYHIILMDQRGCGQSRPFGKLKNNTTQYLLDDMEQIRKQLKIEKWLLFGGSWGSTLTLLYAQQNRSKVLGMVIRGVFLARKKDMDWFVKKDGVARIYPEKWQQLLESIAQLSEIGVVDGLYQSIFSHNKSIQDRVLRAWINWGGQLALQADFKEDETDSLITKTLLKQVRMELHYAKNDYFIIENEVIENCDALQHIPAIIVHGRHDLVCPIEAGLSLSQRLPHAEFKVLQRSGHIAGGEEMVNALVEATDKMLELIK